MKISTDHVWPIKTISLDPLEKNLREKLKLYKQKSPYIFFTENGRLSAYMMSGKVDPKMSVKLLRQISNRIDVVGVINMGETMTVPFIFQALGEPITLVKSNDEITGYIQREDLLIELSTGKSKSTNFLKIMLASIPMGLFIVDENEKFVDCNETGLKMIRHTYDAVMNMNPGDIFNESIIKKVFTTGETILNQIHVAESFGILADYSPIFNEINEITGVMVIVQDLPRVEEMAMEIEYVKDLNADLNAILSSMYDEIIIVNNKGDILRHSKNLQIDSWEKAPNNLIGKNILKLEDDGLLSQLVTRRVLKEKRKTSIVREMENGRNVVSIGNPILNDDGEIHRIVIASRDITETTKLKMELQETKQLTAAYEQELETLRNREIVSNKIIYRSSKMERVMEKIDKLAEFNSTVMIQGESGVGKELIAQAIHDLGNRSHQPFLALNCGAIPENLLESELFGYKKGAFTGANPDGKVGYFEQADQGVLFLDEISELPPHLQVKLLRALQEKEITPLGSTESISVDVQIITATNQNIQDLVAKGKFREDLYYRLHVIPIDVPALRERPEDISLLAHHFLNKLNKKYNKNYHFSPVALSLFEAYHWPGNIRELKHLIERIVVLADDDEITAEFISPFLNFAGTKHQQPLVTDVIPLKEAQQSLEKQLIQLAMKRYKTTTKAAEVLGVSQSTVSRKYSKILEEKDLSNK